MFITGPGANRSTSYVSLRQRNCVLCRQSGHIRNLAALIKSRMRMHACQTLHTQTRCYKQVINLLFRSMYQKPEKPRQRCALLPRLLTTIVAHLTAGSKNHAVFCGPNHRARRKYKQKAATLKAFKTRSQSREVDWERPGIFLRGHQASK